MTRCIEAYFWLLKGLIAILLAAMMVLVFGNVILRYFFGSGIIVSEEISRWLFVWMVFLGAVIGMREHAHIGVESLVRRLPRRARQVCFALSHGLMLYATVLIVDGSWQQTLINADIVAPASGLSLSIIYVAGLVFGISTFAILVVEMYRLFLGQLPEDRLDGTKNSIDV